LLQSALPPRHWVPRFFNRLSGLSFLPKCVTLLEAPFFLGLLQCFSRRVRASTPLVSDREGSCKLSPSFSPVLFDRDEFLSPFVSFETLRSFYPPPRQENLRPGTSPPSQLCAYFLFPCFSQSCCLPLSFHKPLPALPFPFGSCLRIISYGPHEMLHKSR